MESVLPSMVTGCLPALTISAPAAARVSSASGRSVALSKSNRASPSTRRRLSQGSSKERTAWIPFGTWIAPGTCQFPVGCWMAPGTCQLPVGCWMTPPWLDWATAWPEPMASRKTSAIPAVAGPKRDSPMAPSFDSPSPMLWSKPHSGQQGRLGESQDEVSRPAYNRAMQLREIPRPVPEPPPPAGWPRVEVAAQILAILGLVAVLELRLLSALIFGLLIYELVELVAPGLERIGVTHKAGKAVALTLLAVVVITALSLSVTGLVSLFTGQSDSVVLLLEKMAEEVDTIIAHLPPWAAGYLPANAGEIEAAAADWLRQHAGQLQMIGQDVGRMLAHSLFGMIIGGMIALTSEFTAHDPKPLAKALARSEER